MILLINMCKEKLHYFEFVLPVEDIVKNENKKCFIKHYMELTKKDIEKADKIIICGTSLKDEEYLKNIEKFIWLKEIDKQVLGICAGMQVICTVFNGTIIKGREIGLRRINFKKNFLGFIGEKEVYELHNHAVDKLKNFMIYAKNEFVQAIKHKNKNIFGVLFYPEVRQKDLIRNFISF